ncbi:hypothetical protein Pcinc_039236 [Petrolisthes cinctipes]|uniref:Uncharacterized protein n=1 Tax=Petrolisthes cinctipes TaxID=88211 RepID=A0AAE1BRZ8_PETCI|nr:hypothetical protein Pcinc_039236 [Petrolisthes cinctipes]
MRMKASEAKGVYRRGEEEEQCSSVQGESGRWWCIGQGRSWIGEGQGGGGAGRGRGRGRGRKGSRAGKELGQERRWGRKGAGTGKTRSFHALTRLNHALPSHVTPCLPSPSHASTMLCLSLHYTPSDMLFPRPHTTTRTVFKYLTRLLPHTSLHAFPRPHTTSRTLFKYLTRLLPPSHVTPCLPTPSHNFTHPLQVLLTRALTCLHTTASTPYTQVPNITITSTLHVYTTTYQLGQTYLN